MMNTESYEFYAETVAFAGEEDLALAAESALADAPVNELSEEDVDRLALAEELLGGPVVRTIIAGVPAWVLA